VGLLVAGVFFRLCGRGGVVFVEGVGGECVCVPGGTPHQGVRTACMRGVCVFRVPARVLSVVFRVRGGLCAPQDGMAQYE
jgi:hypothetical protein